jgi:hypothetical protein
MDLITHCDKHFNNLQENAEKNQWQTAKQNSVSILSRLRPFRNIFKEPTTYFFTNISFAIKFRISQNV